MSVALLAIALGVALAAIAVVLNHTYARLAVVELTLNEGLPPGFSPEPVGAADKSAVSPADIARRLNPGVHIFLSRNCVACQRLIDELDQTTVATDAPLHLRYVDRPRPIAQSAAQRQGAHLFEHEAELAQSVGADPLPYVVAIGDHGLLATSVSPTVALILSAARNAGIVAAVNAEA